MKFSNFLALFLLVTPCFAGPQAPSADCNLLNQAIKRIDALNKDYKIPERLNHTFISDKTIEEVVADLNTFRQELKSQAWELKEKDLPTLQNRFLEGLITPSINIVINRITREDAGGLRSEDYRWHWRRLSNGKNALIVKWNDTVINFLTLGASLENAKKLACTTPSAIEQTNENNTHSF